MKQLAITLLALSALVILLLSFRSNTNKPVIAFFNSLDKTQLKKVKLSFEDLSRCTWHFLPGKMWGRSGIQLDELTERQKMKFSHLLKEFLSEAGYNKTQEIIELENVLAEIENNRDFRDPGKYFIAIYGNPREDSLWAWSFEGHHISLNFTILNDKISASPRFFGVNPATIQSGRWKGKRVLDKEEDIAFDLLNSLNREQRQKAIFQQVSFTEIVTSNATEVAPLNPVGIQGKELSSKQQLKLKDLIQVYLSSLPEKLSTARAQKINLEEFAEIRFGWAGGTTLGVPHYYRIQGKTFLIEFDNTQNQANHIHTVWRDFDGDFGRDLIREHYHHADHHKKD